MMVSSTSPLESMVLIFSFSKNTGIFLPFNCRMYFRQSSVFFTKRLIDLVMTILIFLPYIPRSAIKFSAFADVSARNAFTYRYPGQFPFGIFLYIFRIVLYPIHIKSKNPYLRSSSLPLSPTYKYNSNNHSSSPII